MTDTRDLFFTHYEEALKRAEEIVSDHTSEGENKVVPIEKMFPHGAQDTLFLVYMKACRSIGYEEAGSLDAVRREMYDIINYAAFTLALLEG